MALRKHKPDPPMDLANMRRQGVHTLIAYCHNDACRLPRQKLRLGAAINYPASVLKRYNTEVGT